MGVKVHSPLSVQTCLQKFSRSEYETSTVLLVKLKRVFFSAAALCFPGQFRGLLEEQLHEQEAVQ